MPGRIPSTYSRHNSTWIKCVNGTVGVHPLNGGERYRVSATGYRSDTVDSLRDLSYVVREYVSALGGTVPFMKGPNPSDYPSYRFEQAQAVVNALLEADDPEMARIRKRVTKSKREREMAELAANPEIQQLDDPTLLINQEVAKRAVPIKKLEVYGRRWFRRGAGGVYCKAYIYINGELVHVTPEQYGYNDHYLTLAKDWLMRNGYLAGLLDDERDPLWTIRDKHGIDLLYSVRDVPRERDL